MTGKELIKYILDNDLENKPVFQNGTFVGYVTPEKFAERYDVGVATVKVWYSIGAVDGIMIGDRVFIADNSVPNMRKEDTSIDISGEILALYIKAQKESSYHE